MIVLICLSLIILLIVLCFIKISITKLKIKNYEDMKSIICMIKEKDYASIFKYADIIIELKLCILNKITILKFKVTSLKLMKIIEKQMKRKISTKQKEKQKKEAKIILPEIKLEKLKFKMDLGTENASLTAISVAGINIMISILLPFLVEYPDEKKYNYEVKPVYIDKEVFKLDSSIIASLSIINLLKAFILDV